MNKEVETQNAPSQEPEASQVQVGCPCGGRPRIRERANNRPVLKCGDLFALLTPSGNFRSGLTDEEGVYFDGTRFLSQWDILLNGMPLSMLGSQVRNDGEELLVVLGNSENSSLQLPDHSILVSEQVFLVDESCYLEILVENFSSSELSTALSFHFGADYADIYEVRGMPRGDHGTVRTPRIGATEVILGYLGLDKEVRSTSISFLPRPARLTDCSAEYELSLPAGQKTTIHVIVSCQRSGREPSKQQSYFDAHKSLGREIEHNRASACTVESSNAQFNTWWNRSAWDLQLLTTSVPTGKYPYAGVPWFNTPFGRDGLITGFETLWMAPELTRGVLAYLASTQATQVDPDQDAEPGKILHETRSGEMAALREMPFGRYYGSVDAPPLFVLLAGAYLRRTGDLVFIHSIWSSIVAALEWMGTYGDRDGDGFLEYERHCEGGLIHQAWKDSDDAIFHQDGSIASGPLAICEVQGYCFAAYKEAAAMALAFGWDREATGWNEEAEQLRTLFNQKFWCEDLGTYGIALDGAKHPCKVKASNAGQLLFSGIVPPDRAARVAQALMHEDFFSGWGVRTLSNTGARYNPMSYHNGSVWPHDNAMIAYGLSRCGFKEPANTLFQGLFSAAMHFDLQRLPELYCGFDRAEGYGPVRYPIACAPQAWAAGSASLFLQASLGIEVDGVNGRIIFHQPTLPAFLDEIRINGLVVGGNKIDLTLRGRGLDVNVRAEGDSGTTEVIIKP